MEKDFRELISATQKVTEAGPRVGDSVVRSDGWDGYVHKVDDEKGVVHVEWAKTGRMSNVAIDKLTDGRGGLWTISEAVNEAGQRYRGAIYVDVWADTDDEAREQLARLSRSIPNAYLGDMDKL